MSIMKTHERAQVKDVGLRVGNLPTLGQHGLQIEVLITTEEGVIEQHTNALRLRVQPYARVEVGWAVLDNHYQRVGIRLAMAAGQQRWKQERDQAAKTKHDFIVRLIASTQHSALSLETVLVSSIDRAQPSDRMVSPP